MRAWLTKARNDFETARQIGALAEGHLDAAIYHCQQAAEKAVKGFLAFCDHNLERTHDLRRLFQLASRYNGEFSKRMHAAITLTPYATAYRYPGETTALEPSRTEFDEALRSAADIVAFILSLMPSDVQPATDPD